MALYLQSGDMALLMGRWDMVVLSISGDMSILRERRGHGFIKGKGELAILM